MISKTEVIIRLVFDGEPDGESELELEFELSDHLHQLSIMSYEPMVWVHIWGAGSWEFRRWMYVNGQHGNRIVEHFCNVRFVEHTDDPHKLSRARGNDGVDVSYPNYFYSQTDLEKPLL
jgi:hypothetical protein